MVELLYLLVAKGFKQPVTAEKEQVEGADIPGADIRHGADHPRQSSVFPQFALWITNGARYVEISRQHSEMPEELDLLESAVLLAVDLPSSLQDPQLLACF